MTPRWTIENIDRYLEQGMELRGGDPRGRQPDRRARLRLLALHLHRLRPDVPAFGVARYLFIPLAESVVFAVMASYVLSRTLIPTLAMYLLREKKHNGNGAHHDGEDQSHPLGIFGRFQQGFEAGFHRVRDG